MMLRREHIRLNIRPKIDEVDIQIIKTLLEAPRTSFTKIAKNCKLSTTAIRNRFNNMQKSGIINGAIMQINPKSFGFNCIALLYIEVLPRERTEIRKFLENQQIAIYEAQLTRRNVIIGFSVARDTDELSRIVKQIGRHHKIRSVSTAIWIDITNTDHPKNLVVEPSDKKLSSKIKQPRETLEYLHTSGRMTNDFETNGQKTNVPKQLDKIDINLIKLLSKNARLSFRSIAKKLGVSPNNVIKRYKELRKEILAFSSITVNLQKLGYIGMGAIFIKVSNKHSLNETFCRILQVPNVIVAIKLFDYYDILVVVPFRDLEDLDNLVEEFSTILGVNEIDVSIDKPYRKWPLNMITELIIQKFWNSGINITSS